jgi:hypothetical protein
MAVILHMGFTYSIVSPPFSFVELVLVWGLDSGSAKYRMTQSGPSPSQASTRTLELSSFGDVDEYLDNLVAPPLGGGTIADSILARNPTRLREEPPTVDGQQSRREPRGSSPENLDPVVRPASREPHEDEL